MWVFFGGYEPLLDQVAQRYPGGVVSQSFTDQYNIYDYKAYYLPNDLLELYSRQESISYPVRAVP